MSYIEPLFDASIPAHYTSIAGVTNAKFPQYTEAAKHIYSQIFAVFDHFGLEYFLFAGSMVGYVRNKQMPRWMDDLDLVIFEDQIPLFENTIIPHLKSAGFTCFPPHGYEQGGYHILGLQLSEYRESSIDYADDIKVRVPWAQIDVFYTVVDHDGYIRNREGWGLYHQKDVPVSWVKPGKKITIDGWRLNAFRKYREDIEREYGDVINNVVVADHIKTILQLDGVHWSAVEKEFEQFLSSTVVQLPPSVTSEGLKDYTPIGECYKVEANQSFDCILKSIIKTHAPEVRLTNPDHVFWVMDLKRLLPTLKITTVLENEKAASRAAHLYAYIDEVTSENTDLMQLLDGHLKYLQMSAVRPWYKRLFGR
jgi:hypothetical protein